MKSDVIPFDDLEPVVNIYDWAENWEWSTSDLFFHRATGSFYFGSDSGCSCNYAYDSFSTASDCEGPFTFDGAIDRLRKVEVGEGTEPAVFQVERQRQRMLTIVERELEDSDYYAE
nr:hypothetical protein [Rhodococcus sp. (in: high G+C Gram-positive bacteria)]